ncbi:hypothetical protein [Anderseniella sp. Alg231-50]|uniref:hypothetical protein n=1 Tax=Anderseniella sp. Alg231-50 TaxID=1922226 RepID=UPI00307B4A04
MTISPNQDETSPRHDQPDFSESRMTQLSRPSHLQQLKAESIHIMREVAAQRPVVKCGAGRVMDRDQPESMENNKQEGYF